MKLTLFTLKFGWGPRSGISVTNVGTIYSHIFDENDTAYQFGNFFDFCISPNCLSNLYIASAALTLTEKYTPSTIQLYMTACVANAHVLALGNHHLRESIPHLTRSYTQLLRAGEKVISFNTLIIVRFVFILYPDFFESISYIFVCE